MGRIWASAGLVGGGAAALAVALALTVLGAAGSTPIAWTAAAALAGIALGLGLALLRAPRADPEPLASLLRATHDTVFLIDGATRSIRAASVRAGAHVGCDRAELVGLPLASVLLGTEGADPTASGPHGSRPATLIRRSGERVPVAVRYTLCRGPEGILIVVAARDLGAPDGSADAGSLSRLGRSPRELLSTLHEAWASWAALDTLTTHTPAPAALRSAQRFEVAFDTTREVERWLRAHVDAEAAAHDVHIALARVEEAERSPDLLLLDGANPDAWAGARTRFPEVPVVAAWPPDTPRERVEELLPGAVDGLIVGPAEQRTVVARLVHWLAHTEAVSEVRKFSDAVVDAQEAERARIAQDLHDSLGQTLTSLSVRLGVTARRVRGTELGASLTALVRFSERASAELAAVTSALRPPPLDELGLQGALRSLGTRLEETHPVHVAMSLGLGDAPLDTTVETTIYRIVQEALHNVVKHAPGSTVAVQLERREDGIRLVIEDDGPGLPLGVDGHSTVAGLGLPGMRERARAVGGTLEIESGGGGVTVAVTLPA